LLVYTPDQHLISDLLEKNTAFDLFETNAAFSSEAKTGFLMEIPK
jgi:hypothetical protein